MKTWKKLTALLLALGLTAGFAACGGNGGGSSEDSGSGSTSTSGTDENSGNQGGVVGDEVTKAEFDAARQAALNATNFSVSGTLSKMVNGAITEMTFTTSCADGKVYTVTTNGSRTEYTYFGQVDGVYYEWTSMNNAIWEYQEYVMEDTEAGEVTTGKYVFWKILKWCENFPYGEYNATTGFYEFSGSFGGKATSVMLVDGKIVKYRSEESGDVWEEGTITYGGATVGNLPELD